MCYHSSMVRSRAVDLSRFQPQRSFCSSLPDTYNHHYLEQHWNRRTRASPSTTRDGHKYSNSSHVPFTICLPPPNVTGSLHIGHALTVAIEDVFCRYHRMRSRPIFWFAGLDHAGIATQQVFERSIRPKSRANYSRTEFVDLCQTFTESSSAEIKRQISRFAASISWNSSFYTQDDAFANAVTEAFLQLHKQGLIIRKKGFINYSPFMKSTLSDVEVEQFPVCGPTDIDVPSSSRSVRFGEMHYIPYSIVESGKSADHIVVATTRPETIPADVALAVHPDDERYKSRVGQNVYNPVMPDRIMPIIADSSVEVLKGTGVLKVTPGHSKFDFEIGVRHKLPSLECISLDGILTDSGHFSGTDRLAARHDIVAFLKSTNRYIKCESIEQVIPRCYRSGDLVEAVLKEQWFLDCAEAGKIVSEAVQSETDMKIVPSYWRQDWLTWLNAGHSDWCLSRQIWWGHRIPAFRCSDSDSWIVAENHSEASKKAGEMGLDGESLQQDGDVLDTWFSSALVPLVIAGWPNTLNRSVYPLSLMQTGNDILKFWVNSMCLISVLLTKQLPFHNVMLHPVIRDAQNRKMSKSLGNVIDPLHVIDGCKLQTLVEQINKSSLPESEKKVSIENTVATYPQGIPACGVDGLRLALLTLPLQLPAATFDSNHLHQSRNFCNKLWHSFKFVSPYLDQYEMSTNHESVLKSDSLTVVDRYTLDRLSRLIDNVTNSIEKFEIPTQNLVDFWHNTICDIYVENCKAFVKNEADQKHRTHKVNMMVLHFDFFLRLLAPFMPMITEELYSRLPCNFEKTSVHDMAFPDSEILTAFKDDSLNMSSKHVLDILSFIRFIRSTLVKSQSLSLNVLVDSESLYHEDLIREFSAENHLKIFNSDSARETAGIPLRLRFPDDNGGVVLYIPDVKRDDAVTVLQDMLKRTYGKIEKNTKFMEQLEPRREEVKFRRKFEKMSDEATRLYNRRAQLYRLLNSLSKSA